MWSQSATPAKANPENMQLHFGWPEYQFIEPAVGYPRHEVIIFRNIDEMKPSLQSSMLNYFGF